jgi:HK97 family phage prohead protease
MENKIIEGRKQALTDVKVLQNSDGVLRIGGYANTKNVADRYGDIPTILSSKRNYVYELAEFKKNPILLTDHRNEVDHIVGSVDTIFEDEKGLYFEATFSQSDLPDVKHARTIYAEGHAKAVSIAGRFHYEDLNAPQLLTLAEIFEISLVAIPADPNALVAPIKANKPTDGPEETDSTDDTEAEQLSAAAENLKAIHADFELQKAAKEVKKLTALTKGKVR